MKLTDSGIEISCQGELFWYCFSEVNMLGSFTTEFANDIYYDGSSAFIHLSVLLFYFFIVCDVSLVSEVYRPAVFNLIFEVPKL